MNFLLHLYTITVYNVEIHKLQFNDKQNKKPTSEGHEAYAEITAVPGSGYTGVVKAFFFIEEMEDVSLEDAQVPLLPEREPETISYGEWYLEVCNAQTGERMTNMKVCGTTLTLDTSSWSTGVYVVRATIGKEVYCEKVYVK